MVKPALGARFSIAHTLSMTILNIHASGWLHQNIWSHGIAIFSSTVAQLESRFPQFDPYLTGWGLARTIDGQTRLTANSEVQSNFYRHAVRQGKPSEAFTIVHDIYSLGVVLLEIGLWRTVSRLFKEQIELAMRNKALPPPKAVKDALIERAKVEVASEMGESYARVVEWCLSGAVLASEGQTYSARLSVGLRRRVIDGIAAGLKL